MKIKLTNRLNLPEPYLRAVENDPYSAGDSDYTATSLLQPARLRRLVQLYPEKCIEDASEKADILIGKAVHRVLEDEARNLAAERPGRYVVENRYYQKFLVNKIEYKISAQIDLYDRQEKLLDDYKTASAASMKYGPKQDHELQLNLQRLLITLAGEVPPERLRITAVVKDWRGDEADRDPNYPQSPALTVEHQIIPDIEIITWVEERIRTHEAAKVQLPLCTDEETWARTDDDEYAVVKPGASRATKLFKNRNEAEQFATSGMVVEERLGKANRCRRYCPARNACEQWKNSPRNPVNQKSSVLVKAEKAGKMPRLKLPDDME